MDILLMQMGASASRRILRLPIIAMAGALIVVLLFSGQGVAGIIPENVIVVVNANSSDSQTLAEHYRDSRGIPDGNLISLSDVPEKLTVSLQEFKTQILSPLLNELDARGLAAQTKVVAYSAGFPTAVSINEHTAKLTDAMAKKYQRPTASLTGLTYFFRFVLGDDYRYLAWESNLYARGVFERHFRNPLMGADGEAFAKADDELNTDKPLDAAVAFETLFDAHPTLSAIAIKAVQGYATAGQLDDAKRMLEKAIKAGWVSGSYLKQTESLQPLLDDPDVGRLISGLDDGPIAMQGPVGFSPLRGWLPSGDFLPAKQSGISYLPACMLGVIHKHGSTLEQAIEVLSRSAACDRTFPDGEFLFSLTGDVRTKTRMPGIADAMVSLLERGHSAKIISTPIPDQENTVNGLMLGAASFDLSKRKWQFSPGAISENLTSLGAAYSTSSQTKLNALLHAGAAISSGAVAEPYSLQFKFPHPMMYDYYARGVTAIEAYYLSVTSPYQLLIVGDPLCQPYARPPNETADIAFSSSLTAAGVVKQLRVRRRPGPANALPSTRPHHVELYLNGKLAQMAPLTANYDIRLPEDLVGDIQVTIAVIGDDPTEPAARTSRTITIEAALSDSQRDE